mmetsp:Transcript_19657/g.46928  ORF Transcript_19657/g.46928 Transcript_19657/m.46928 type:complete len:208 (-) Transcript_19657:287-910(-)
MPLWLTSPGSMSLTQLHARICGTNGRRGATKCAVRSCASQSAATGFYRCRIVMRQSRVCCALRRWVEGPATTLGALSCFQLSLGTGGSWRPTSSTSARSGVRSVRQAGPPTSSQAPLSCSPSRQAPRPRCLFASKRQTCVRRPTLQSTASSSAQRPPRSSSSSLTSCASRRHASTRSSLLSCVAVGAALSLSSSTCAGPISTACTRS